MDSEKGLVVFFSLLTLGKVFHVKNSLCLFFCDYLLGILFFFATFY